MHTALHARKPEIETLIPLSRVEARRLKECEKVIERGLDTFYDVGNALTEIRDSRLYRMEHASFEDYCRDRWDMSRPRAYQFIGAAAVMNNLSTMVDKPANERQVRELTPLDSIAQKAVWQIALATAPKNKDGEATVTAGHISSVVKVIADIVDCGGVDDGSGEVKPLGTLIDAAVTEETYERLQRQKEYIKESQREKEAKPPKPDKTEIEMLADPETQALMDRYMKVITEFEEETKVPHLRLMFQTHKAHAHWQKKRNLADDCEAIARTVRKTGDGQRGDIGASHLYEWLLDLGYFMGEAEYKSRLEYMNRDDVRLALLTDAGEGKQDDRRGALPGIVCIPWRKVWDFKSKRPRDDDEDAA